MTKTHHYHGRKQAGQALVQVRAHILSHKLPASCLKVQHSKSILRFMQSLNCNPMKVKLKKKKTNHILPTYTLLSQNVGREHSEEILDQSKTENQLGKLQTLNLHVWCSTPFSFVGCNNVFLLGWLHSLLAPLLSRYPRDGSNILGYSRKLQLYSFLFQCLGSTYDLLGSSKGLGSHLQLCPL